MRHHLRNATRWSYFFALCIIVLLLTAWLVQREAQVRLVLPDNTDSITINVATGSTFNGLVNQLIEQDYLEPSGMLRKAWIKSRPDTADIKAGYYAITPDLTLHTLLKRLQRGDVVRHNITLVEGQPLWQWLAQMEKTQNITLDVSFDPNSFEYTDTNGVIWQEGYVLPETYQYLHLATASSILRQAQLKQAEQLSELLTQYTLPTQLTNQHEWITLASIVEKETGVAAERTHIAGVFLHRLSKSMRLQTDPTVIYGIGPDFNGDITRADLRRATPFNTYVINGLPPSAIAAPSQAALLAVLTPLATNDLYFVAKGNGEHYFSETLQQHNQAVRQYQLKR